MGLILELMLLSLAAIHSAHSVCTFEFTIKTGCQQGAGTGSDVDIVFTESDGSESGLDVLSSPFTTFEDIRAGNESKFKTCATDMFKETVSDDCFHVRTLQLLTRDDSVAEGALATWFVDSVTLKVTDGNMNTLQDNITFSIHSWMEKPSLTERVAEGNADDSDDDAGDVEEQKFSTFLATSDQELEKRRLEMDAFNRRSSQCVYKISIETGALFQHGFTDGTGANVDVIFFNRSARAEFRKIGDSFPWNSVKKFTKDGPCLERIDAMFIKQDETGFSSDWFLRSVRVVVNRKFDAQQQLQDAKFRVDAWLRTRVNARGTELVETPYTTVGIS